MRKVLSLVVSKVSKARVLQVKRKRVRQKVSERLVFKTLIKRLIKATQ